MEVRDVLVVESSRKDGVQIRRASLKSWYFGKQVEPGKLRGSAHWYRNGYRWEATILVRPR